MQMSRAGTALIIIVLLVVVGLAQDGRKITGTVVSAGGEPVVNANVSYMDAATQEEQTTRTDAKGLFEFLYGTGGVVTVRAQKYGTMRRSWPPRKSTSLRFELKPPAVLSGTLVDAVTRQGIAGDVTVRIYHPFNHVSKTGRTNGVFRFVDLPPGPGIIYAHAKGFAPRFGTLEIDAGRSYEMQVDLMPEAQVSGHVLDAESSPVPGAVVYVGYDPSMEGGRRLAGLAHGNMVADQDGAFHIQGLVPDTPIALRAELDGRLSDVVTISSIDPGFERPGIVLRMQ